MRYNRLTAICVPILLLLSGCIFSPKRGTGGGPPRPKYEPLATPENVLIDLSRAYSSKDSNEVKLLYHNDYTGTTIDQSNPLSILHFDFTKADEVGHVAGLARNIAVFFVDLELSPLLATLKLRYHDAGDPPGIETVQRPITRLAVYDDQNRWEVPLDKDYIEFKFIAKTPDSSSLTDTTWQIYKFTETFAP